MSNKVIMVFSLLLSLLILMFTSCTDNRNNINGDEQNPDEMVTVTDEMKIQIGEKTFNAKLYGTEAAKEFAKMLPLTLLMSDMHHEKYCYFDTNLTTSPYSPKTIEEGDIMLWGTNCLVIFYETFATSYSYTRIGKITDTSGLVNAFSKTNIVVLNLHFTTT